MSKNKTVFKERRFLNESDESLSGHFIAVIDKTSIVSAKDESKIYFNNYPTFKIADCSSSINLDFAFYNYKTLYIAKKKVLLLQELVNKFADAFKKETEDVESRLRKRKKKLKKKAIAAAQAELEAKSDRVKV